MNTYEIVKELAVSRKISVAELERTLNLSNGSISKWARSMPNSELISKVADYFNVSVDYLLGRTKTPSLVDSGQNDMIAFFRMNTEGLDDEEKEILEQDLKDFMEVRRKRLEERRKNK